jgi:60 kDa SS-A/Ro ribonucleoprotein
LALGATSMDVPDVPFQMLTALPLTTAHWAQIARAGSWQMVRQNLNTFARHGVFGVQGMAEVIAAKLRDPQAVAKARVLPYQLMSAFHATGDALPALVRDALQDAMEAALINVPAFDGRVVAQAVRRQCAASTWRRWWRRQCCARTARRVCCRSSKAW